MNAHRVHILHAADGNGVAGPVTHDLELDFLPAVDVFLDKYLSNGGEHKAVSAYNVKLRLIICNAAAGTSQGKGGADYNGIAYSPCDFLCGLNIRCNVRGNYGLTDFKHRVLEHLSVLGLANGLGIGAEELYAVLFEEALL